jgi:hypothetical protein
MKVCCCRCRKTFCKDKEGQCTEPQLLSVVQSCVKTLANKKEAQLLQKGRKQEVESLQKRMDDLDIAEYIAVIKKETGLAKDGKLDFGKFFKVWITTLFQEVSWELNR